jgi:hypothetical protein
VRIDKWRGSNGDAIPAQSKVKVARYFKFTAQAGLMKGNPYKADPFSLIFF